MEDKIENLKSDETTANTDLGSLLYRFYDIKREYLRVNNKNIFIINDYYKHCARAKALDLLIISEEVYNDKDAMKDILIALKKDGTFLVIKAV